MSADNFIKNNLIILGDDLTKYSLISGDDGEACAGAIGACPTTTGVIFSIHFNFLNKTPPELGGKPVQS